jgi:excisionase family DNA binding protein
MKDTLTSIGARQYLNIRVRTIHCLVNTGEIPDHKVGGCWRFKKPHWMNSFRVENHPFTESMEELYFTHKLIDKEERWKIDY